MRVVLLNGSPHAEGCTYTILLEAACELNKHGVEAEIIHVGRTTSGATVALPAGNWGAACSRMR